MTESMGYAHAAEGVLRPGESELLDAWRALVEASADQAARLRETEPSDDQWAGVYANAPIDPDRSGAMDRELARLAEAGDGWLDIGAGHGRTTLPLSRHVRGITAVEPSPGLNGALRANVARFDIGNVDVLEPQPWPPLAPLGMHQVCVAVNVVNFVADIGPFLNAMEAHASRLCVVSATELGTAVQPVEPIFEELHEERFIRLPALREFVGLLSARQRRFDIVTHLDMPGAVREPQPLDVAHARVRGHYLVREGSAKDVRLRELLQRHFSVDGGLVQLPAPVGNFAAVISWEPPQQ